MRLTLIVAADEKNVIGKGNTLPWHLPDDMKRFRELTKGHPVIMGRKTWESIPAAHRPLPGRVNIVISRHPEDLAADGAHVVSTIDDAIEAAKESGAEEAFVIGGGQIYKEALPRADRIELTRVHAEVEKGEVYFPVLDPDVWKEVARTDHPVDDRHQYAFTFITYERKR